MKFYVLLLSLLLCRASFVHADEGDSYTLPEILALTLQNSPNLAVSNAKREGARFAVDSVKSKYLPTVNVEAIDSTGFGGSSGGLGVTGLMGSPFRSGYSYGAVLNQTIFDFNRSASAVAEAESSYHAREADVSVTKYNIKSQAIRAFYECSLLRSQAEAWNKSSEESLLVMNEVKRFVQSGQRSLVDRYLVESQTEEALTKEASYSELYRGMQLKLQLFSGSPVLRPCPVLKTEVRIDSLKANKLDRHPAIEKAKWDFKTSEAARDRKRAEFLPYVVGMASIGQMESTRLIGKKDYSLSAAIIFPIFDGLKTTSEVHRSEAAVVEKEMEVRSVKFWLEETELRLVELHLTALAKLKHLKNELVASEEGYRLAKDRYGNFRGSLVDVRETLRNLSRVRAEMNDTLADIAIASAQHSLLSEQ